LKLAITGVGVLSAGGRGVEALRCAPQLGPLPEAVGAGLPMQVGGRFPEAEVPAADPRRAFLAAGLALDDALAAAGSPPCELILGTGLGPMELQLARFADPPAPGQLTDALPSSLTAELARTRGLRAGPTFCVTCVSASYGLEAARAALAGGRVEAVALLGVETLNRQIQGGFCALDALAKDYAPGGPPPRDGIVLGEAACCVILEPLARARARGAQVLGVLHAARVWVDATHLIAPDPGGAGLGRALDAALADAGLELGEVDALTLTADGSPLYAETYRAALEPRFPAWRARVESWETGGGHALAASGSLGLAWAVGRPQPGWTVNLTVGFGGQNAVSVVGPPPAEDPPLALGEDPGWSACAWATAGAPDLEDRFAPRWNPRRPLPAELRPAVEAGWSALEAAGWARAPGDPVDGGLLLAVDRPGFAAAERFAQQLGSTTTSRPAPFIASLPSTPAGTLGLLFGLHAYQATISHPELAPLYALQHARDLLRAGTLRRVLLVALSTREPAAQARWDGAPEEARFAVALTLERGVGELRIGPVNPEREAGSESAAGPLLADLSPSYRGLPAAGLLAVTRATAPGSSWAGGWIELHEGGPA